MPDIVTSLRVGLPDETPILEYLNIEMTDAGLVLTAKSKCIGEFIRAKAGGVFRMETTYNPDWVGEYYKISAKYYNSIPISRPSLMINRPGEQETANVFWLFKVGLDEGIKEIFPEPIHLPADLVTYTTSACERVKEYFLKFVYKPAVSAKLTLVE